MVFRFAMPTKALATGAVEHQRGGVEQHNGEIAEQTASAFEQRLLEQVFDATRCTRCPALIGQFFAEPGHRPIELVQLQAFGAIDVIGIQPLLAGTVGPGDHQPMQDAGKHRPLDRKAKAASFGELLNHRATASLFPQTTEDHRCTDAHCRAGLERSCLQAGDQQGGLAEPRAGAQQHIELAIGLQFLDASEGGEHALDGAGAVARVFDDLQIAALTGWFDAEEHAAPNRDTAILPPLFNQCQSLDKPTRVRHGTANQPNFRPSAQ
jgi:hypothetical protein